MGSRNLSIDAGFLVFIATLILLFPIRLIIAWFVAIIIHELGHYTALRLLRIRVYSVRLRVFGAVMITEPISGWREAFCAAAGPIAGFCVLLIARWMPCTAVFAFVHSVYNLLPISSLDGGRIFKCVLRVIFKKISLQRVKTNSTISKTKHLERYK